MKKLIAAFFLFFSFSAFAQSTASDSVAISNCETQGNMMAKLLFEKKYDAFIKYMYAPLLKLAGGADNMTRAVKKSMDDLETQGYSFTNISIDKPATIIHTDKTLQCVVMQHIEMKVPGGRVTSNASLIGISNDNGKNWTFIDTHGADLKTLQKSIPALSNQLSLPEKEKPVFYKD